MTCNEFEALLQTCLDRGSVDRALFGDEGDEHRATCAACRESWDRARLLADAILDWREQTPEVDLVEATVAAYIASASSLASASSPASSPRASVSTIRSVESSRRMNAAAAARRWTRIPAIVAVAGLAAVVFVMAVLPRKEAKEATDPQLAVGERTSETCKEPAVESPSERNEERAVLPAEADATYGALARKAAGAIEDLAWRMRPSPAMPPVPEEGERAPQSWIDGLRPIGRSVGDTFDFLWEVGRTPDENRT